MSEHRPAANRLVPVLLLGILVLAAVLRLFDLPQRGLIYWDEGKFALEGIRLQQALYLLAGQSFSSAAGKPVGTAKPGHALLIAVAYLLLGGSAYAALAVNAVAGTCSVAITFVLGRRLWGAATGLLASLLLAVSEYDVIYARSALSESDATVFLLAAAAVLLQAGYSRDGWQPARSWWPRLAAGALLGFGFSVNYRLIVYCAFLIGLDLVWSLAADRRARRLAPFTSSARHAAEWIAGFAVPVVAWQGVDVVAAAHGLHLFRSELGAPTGSYWREVLYQLHGGKQTVIHFEPLIYLQWWVSRQGWPASLVLFAGLAYAAIRRTRPLLLAAAMVVLPYTVYVFAPFYVPRNLAAAVPFGALLSATVLVRLGAETWARRSLVAGAVLILAGLGAAMSWRLTGVRSGFAAAGTWIDRHGGRALTSNEVMVFYLRGHGSTCDAPAVPLSQRGLAAYRRAGYRYAVIDTHHSTPVVASIVAQGRVLARFLAFGAVSIGESLIATENSDQPGGTYQAETVTVYGLDALRLPLPDRARASPCRRYQVT